MHLVVCNFA